MILWNQDFGGLAGFQLDINAVVGDYLHDCLAGCSK